MVRVKNNDIFTVLQKLTLLNPHVDKKIPVNLKEEITPVIDLSPNIVNENQDIVRSRTTNGTLYTTSSTMDFYLTSYVLTSASDGAGSSANTQITFTCADGTSNTVIVNTPGTSTVSTATDTAACASVTFPGKGVLLKKNTTITCAMGTNGCASISGYNQNIDIYELP